MRSTSCDRLLSLRPGPYIGFCRIGLFLSLCNAPTRTGSTSAVLIRDGIVRSDWLKTGFLYRQTNRRPDLDFVGPEARDENAHLTIRVWLSVVSDIPNLEEAIATPPPRTTAKQERQWRWRFRQHQSSVALFLPCCASFYTHYDHANRF